MVFNTLSINRVKSYTCCPCSDSRRICEACARASALCTHARMHAHVRRNAHAVSDRRRTGDCVVCTVWLPRKPGIPRGRAGFGAHALPRNDCQRQQKVDAGHSAIPVISVEQPAALLSPRSIPPVLLAVRPDLRRGKSLILPPPPAGSLPPHFPLLQLVPSTMHPVLPGPPGPLQSSCR